MRIVTRDKSNAHFEPPGKVSPLCFIQTSEQSFAPIFTINTNRAIAVVVEGAERLTFEFHEIVRVEHFRDKRGPGVELTSVRAKKSANCGLNHSKPRSQ